MTQNALDKTNNLPKMKKLCRIYKNLHTLPRMRYRTRDKQRNNEKNPLQKILRKVTTMSSKNGIRQWTTMQLGNRKSKTGKACNESIDALSYLFY